MTIRQNKLILFTTVALLTGSVAHASTLGGVLENNAGVDRLMTKKPVEAFDKFTNALGDLPYSAVVHYNLGTTFLTNKEYDKAVSEFREAVHDAPTTSKSDLAVRYHSFFNMAVALNEQKKIDEALEAYQNALEANPQSIETKTNIELLTRQNQGDGQGDQDQQNKDNKDSKSDKDNKDKKDGQGKDKDQKQDQKDQKDPKDSKDPKKDKQQQSQQPKPTPHPFKSQELSPQDVGKILDELKNQEEQIRARMQNEQTKDAPADKDW